MSSATPLASLLAHGLLFGSLFACPSKPFAALGLHFWRPRGTYLLVFEVSLTSISFFHAPHSNKEPTGFQSGNNKSFASPIRSVSQICCKKCAASSQLMPREARHLRLVYIDIYMYMGTPSYRPPCFFTTKLKVKSWIPGNCLTLSKQS